MLKTKLSAEILILAVIFTNGVLAQSHHMPPQVYLITIHYDLGMHCTGFDLSYCCILPPYNSVLSQTIKTPQTPDELPTILTEADLSPDSLILWYRHEKNSYSEGPKMLYWNVPYDVNGDGDLADPNDSFANAWFRHLFKGHNGISCQSWHKSIMADDTFAPFSNREYPTRWERAVEYAHTGKTHEERKGIGKCVGDREKRAGYN